MTICLGKSCSFGLPRVPFVNCFSIYAFSYFPFGFEGRMWDLIVLVPDHCLTFYFGLSIFIHQYRGDLILPLHVLGFVTYDKSPTCSR